jgi:hypothetical protein
VYLNWVVVEGSSSHWVLLKTMREEIGSGMTSFQFYTENSSQEINCAIPNSKAAVPEASKWLPSGELVAILKGVTAQLEQLLGTPMHSWIYQFFMPPLWVMWTALLLPSIVYDAVAMQLRFCYWRWWYIVPQEMCTVKQLEWSQEKSVAQ